MFDHKLRETLAQFARDLNVDPAALMAVVHVESGGRLSTKVRGRQEPLIRFEGHYFDRFLEGDALLQARQVKLADPKAGRVKNPRKQADRWDLLDRAIAINRIAALSSTSWGVGQVMGSHWKWLGYGSVDAMVAVARSGVAGQVSILVRYVDKAGLAKALRQQDWAAFARTYNGPAYRRNRYDTRMEKAFKRYSKIMRDEALSLPKPADVPSSGLEDHALRFGAKGLDVRKLQRKLSKRGYVLVEDGLFGLVTDRVIRQFQRDSGLPETGVVGVREALLLGLRDFHFGMAVANATTKLVGDSLLAGRWASRALGELGSGFGARVRDGLLSISRRLP